MQGIRRRGPGLFLAGLALGLLGAMLLLIEPPPAKAYVEAAHSLGQVVQLSSNIMVLRVEKVDKEKNMILYRKVRDLKGTNPTDVVKHNIGRGGFHPREWQYPMEWAEPGKTAIFFHNGGASETCTGTYWYQAYSGGEWWNMSHGEPFLLRSFAGNPEKLSAAVTEMLAGREVVVPCMVDGNKEDLHLRRARIHRLRVSLKLQDYNPKRDFVGWGGEDFRRLMGMPAFTHISALPRIDPDIVAAACADFDGDGRIDVCLAGASRTVLLQNGPESLNEVSLPGWTGGTRAAIWGDYNGDGPPDLLLAAPQGPKLFTNLGKGVFRDDSHLLPPEEGYHVTSAAWMDENSDGRLDLVLGNGYHGLRLYRNLGKAEPVPGSNPPLTRWFADASEKVGLAAQGRSGRIRAEALAIADVDGDSKPDVLVWGESGLLLHNYGNGFTEVEASGILRRPGDGPPVFGDYDADGRPDVVVPGDGGARLYHNEGKGRFAEVTARSGDLGKAFGQGTCAAWGDFDGDGKLDLVVGCLRDPNRVFRNRGDGTFVDVSESLGLLTRIYNTRAVAFLDINRDRILDLIFANEGQESCALLRSAEFMARK